MAAIFAHSSSGPLPLRTLTLGVLIVSGGTVAALPFRRYQAIPDSSTTPVHVTGPTNSALQMSAANAISGAAFAPPQMAEAILPGSILATHSENTGVSRNQHEDLNSSDRIPPLANTTPAHGGPLTYEDLVLPIEMPDIVQQRFNATAAVKSIQMENEHFANADKSRMEPMTATSPDAPNAPDTSLLASKSRNESINRSVLQPTALQSGDNQSATGRSLTGQSSNSHADSRRDRAAENRGTQQFPFAAEPTVVANMPADTENTAGSLASASAARNISTKQLMSANPANSEMLPTAESNRLVPREDAPTRPRHWIRQPD